MAHEINMAELGTLLRYYAETASPMNSLLNDSQLHDLRGLARKAPPGNFVEVGVYRGGSALALYKIAEEQGRTLHLYDTFAGHPVVDPARDNVSVHPAGRFAEAAESLDAMRAAMPNAVFHVGIFPDTLVDMTPVAFVHSDVDVYWPTLAVCTKLPPMMVSGGMLLFDDYNYTDACPGVKAAVHEVFKAEITIRPTGKALVTIP